jgi:pseudaminic acid synthase
MGNRVKLIGDDVPVFIVAEASANHGQDINRAVRLIKLAKKCGASAIKFQAYTPETMTIDVDNKYFRIKHPKWGGQTLFDLYGKACTPWKWFKKLKKVADDVGITFFATAFDKTSVDMLEEIKVPVHKIASFELVDLGLIEYAAKTGKPLILSTGMSLYSEIKDAVGSARKAGARNITLLKCNSSYPARPDEMNLKTIIPMGKAFKCTMGFSDHSMGVDVSITAVSLGARMIEKHFTLSRKIETPDSFFSIEPEELKNLVHGIRTVEKAVGMIRYGLTDDEKKSIVFRRSLFVVEDIKAGDIFSEDNIRSIRPSYGISPKYLPQVLGRRARRDMKRGFPLNIRDVA